MNEAHWQTVDDYFAELFSPPDPILAAALTASEAAGLPNHQVSPLQGKLLEMLVQMQGARRILEIGTLGGYSTIWLARALPPDGCLITLEANPTHADVASANIAQAGLANRVRLRLGRALDTLPRLASEGGDPFDLIFIDADKRHNAEYFTWALRLSHPGTLIIADNVVRGGAVTDATSTDPSVVGTRRFNALVAAEPRVSVTAIQTVGCKGYDGFALIRVNS